MPGALDCVLGAPKLNVGFGAEVAAGEPNNPVPSEVAGVDVEGTFVLGVPNSEGVAGLGAPNSEVEAVD